jgi:hypothetical protein
MENPERKPKKIRMSEKQRLTITWGVLVLTLLTLVMAFGRECNREDTRFRMQRREMLLKCMQAGQDSWKCSQFM